MKQGIEWQVSSLELSKRLKELGVRQDSDWKHCENRQTAFNGPTTLRSVDVEEYNETSAWAFQYEIFCSAFTVAELGEMLPRYIADKDQQLSGVKGKQYPLIIECLADDYSSDNKINGWRIRYGDTKVKIDSEYKLNSAGIYYVGSEADARAKMLIYLIEQGLVDVKLLGNKE